MLYLISFVLSLISNAIHQFVSPKELLDQRFVNEAKQIYSQHQSMINYHSIFTENTKLQMQKLLPTQLSWNSANSCKSLLKTWNSTLTISSIDFLYCSRESIAEMCFDGAITMKDCVVCVNTVMKKFITANGAFTEIKNISFVFSLYLTVSNALIQNEARGGISSIKDTSLSTFIIGCNYPLFENENTQKILIYNCNFNNFTHSDRSPEQRSSEQKTAIRSVDCCLNSNTFQYIDNVFYGGLVHGLLSKSYSSYNSSFMHCKWAYKKHKTDRVNSSFIHDSFIDVTHYGEGGALTIEGEDGCLKIENCLFEDCSCKPEKFQHDYKGNETYFREEIGINSFDGCGGAICVSFYSKNIRLSIKATSFSYCKAVNDGGAVCAKDYYELEDCSFERCSTENGNGGGFAAYSTKNTSFFKSCKFFNCCSGCYSQASPGTNCAYEQSSIVYLENFHGGGGICFTSSKGLVFLQECTFIRCSAFNGRGGASFLSYKPTKYASVKFERCKFFSNSANEHGNDIATVSDWADLIQCTDLCHECESNSLSPKVSIGDDDKEDFWITGECGNKYTDPVSDDPKDILVGTIVCCVALFFIVFIVRMVIVRCQHVEWIFDDTSEFSIELMDEECDTDECVNRPPTPDPPSPGVASYLNNLPNENAPTESNRIEFIQ